MVKKPKRTSKMLALLMAVVMTVGSVPTTAFAANSSSIGASSSSLEGLFRLWQPYGYRLLCRKRNHLLDSRICSLGCQRLTKDRKHLSGGAFFIKQGEIFFIGNAHCGGTEYEKNSRNADNEPRGIKARGVHKLADKQVADSGKSTGCNGYYRVHPSPMR